MVLLFISIVLSLIPGQSQPPFREIEQDDIKLINSMKIKNVKIDFFILS